MMIAVYQMVANIVAYNGKYRTGAKLARFATGCTSELKEQLEGQRNGYLFFLRSILLHEKLNFHLCLTYKIFVIG